MKPTNTVNERELTLEHQELTLPIKYHAAIEAAFDGWAASLNLEPQRLREMTDEAICTRHNEARIDHPSHMRDEFGPDVYTLFLDAFRIFFSIDPQEVTVRGYAWDPGPEPLDDLDGGCFCRN